MNIFGISGILILTIVLSLLNQNRDIPFSVQNFIELQKSNNMDVNMSKIQQPLQTTEDTLNRGLKAENNSSLFYSTMPVLKAIPSENMTIMKPDTNIDYQILNKKVIVIDPLSEEKNKNMPFNLELIK